jgi:hypothetical protein
MIETLQGIILNSWVVGIMLFGAFIVISRWSLVHLKEYAGYALGILVGMFFMLVYISLGGGTNDSTIDPVLVRRTLNIFEVFIATFFGMMFGAVVIIGLRFGTRFARGVSLQVAFYTALNVILLFMVVIAGPITQRMIGIFALSIGIASLFAMVLFPDATRQAHISSINAQSFNPQGYVDTGAMQPPVDSGNRSRLDQIRNKIQQKR